MISQIRILDKVDTVASGATSAFHDQNAVMESLGLTLKEEVLAPAPETVEEGTYGDSDEKYDKYSRT